MDSERQRDLFDPDAFPWRVHVVGLGGIGSAVAPVLAKLGVQRFTLWDDDVVEDGNLMSQLCYRAGDVGRPKVEAAADVLRSFGPVDVTTEQRRVTAEDQFDGIVVVGVDSMASRSTIWRAVRYGVRVPLYLDGRLGGEHLELHTVRPYQREDVERYEASLFPDAEAAPLPCGARAIIHPAVILAGLVASQLTRWVRGERWQGRIVGACQTTMFVAESPVPGAHRAAHEGGAAAWSR